LSIYESKSPISYIKKFELIEGDASTTLEKWLKKEPHTVIGKAIFDMNLYKPTRDVLLSIKPHLFKGSIVVFDDFNCYDVLGET